MSRAAAWDNVVGMRTFIDDAVQQSATQIGFGGPPAQVFRAHRRETAFERQLRRRRCPQRVGSVTIDLTALRRHAAKTGLLQTSAQEEPGGGP